MKKSVYLPLILLLGITLSFSGCRLISEKEIGPAALSENMETWTLPPDFDFETRTTLSLQIETRSPQDEALPFVGLRFSLDSLGEALLGTVQTDARGLYTGTLSIPASQKYLYILPQYLGLPAIYALDIEGITSQVLVLGGKAPQQARLQSPAAQNKNYAYLGTYDSQGVPFYLEPLNDVIDASFLANVNATLPENYPVPNYHPEYLAQGNDTDLKIMEPAEVWITFVHEGAGWRNVLGFYTYDLNNPPQTKQEIQNATVIFPNVSRTGSGGGLFPGNKVKLGTFPANTGLGWFLVSNGWNGSSITPGHYTVYSNPAFNPESNPSLRQHNVLIEDAVRQRVLIGFEDIRRDQSSDNDFNDAVFYVSANPFTAIESSAMPTIAQTGTDSDQDGVADPYDAFPQDADRALYLYSPSATTQGTLAFEDLWPGRGDYDFNDLVVDYRMALITNGANAVKEIQASFTIQAVGASYANGLGWELPVMANAVASVSGSQLTENYIQRNPNGTEAGQEKAVVIVFDNALAHIQRPTGHFYNTEPGQPKGSASPIDIRIVFENPVPVNTLGEIPFNPFLIVNGERGKEIHLKNQSPTLLANAEYLGTQQDASDPSNGVYYQTQNGLPFALHLPEKFAYPVEKASLSTTHLRFGEWATSGGTVFKDWYQNKSGYRTPSQIYPR